MSASEKAAETAINVAADAAEEVSEKAEEFAEYARQLNKTKVQFYLLGMAVGGLTGAVVAFKVAYRKAETKYSQIADDEIAGMREHYHSKIVAVEAAAAKRPVEEIVKDRGYVSPDEETQTPPMAVQPPASVVEDETTEDEEPQAVENVFNRHGDDVEHEWDWHEERKSRSPTIPYVIHYDEREEMDYQVVTLTYYEGDDVVCNERDEIIDPADRDRLFGEANLSRFGHGSNDSAIVYIQNDHLELVYEMVKSPNSYAEEVHGIRHDSSDRGNLERMRARERDEDD